MSFWISKLAAFLHDPPHKQFDIPNHEIAREPILRHLGITEEEMKGWSKIFDWWASAADRYPFPSARQLVVDWKTDGHLQFHHPLSGTRFTPSKQPRENSAVGEKWLEDSLHGLCFDEADNRARFFRLWRFWAERAAREKNDLMAYLPADSRIPDHTIWQHLALCCALDSAQEKEKTPAFLMMQIGPVQEFIAQSRKMQDLWSGSFLLSYLISKAIAAIALDRGADAIIYPNLRGVPLLDWAWSKEEGLFPSNTFQLGAERLHPDELLVPSLPNRFLALVPAGDEGQRLATLAANAIREEWKRIADAVHEDICSKLSEHFQNDAFSDWDNVWESQIARFPSIDYVLHPWEPDVVKKVAAGTPPLLEGWEQHPLYHAEKWRETLDPSKHSHANMGSASKCLGLRSSFLMKRDLVLNQIPVERTELKDRLRSCTPPGSGKVFLVVDGHPSHRTKLVARYIEKCQGALELHFLPPYAPDLNPDEFVWQHAKTNGAPKRPSKRNESLKERVESDLKYFKANSKLVRVFF